MTVADTGGPLKVPVGKGIRSRMSDVFDNALAHATALSDVQWRSEHRAPPLLAHVPSGPKFSWKARCRPISLGSGEYPPGTTKALDVSPGRVANMHVGAGLDPILPPQGCDAGTLLTEAVLQRQVETLGGFPAARLGQLGVHIQVDLILQVENEPRPQMIGHYLF